MQVIKGTLYVLAKPWELSMTPPSSGFVNNVLNLHVFNADDLTPLPLISPGSEVVALTSMGIPLIPLVSGSGEIRGANIAGWKGDEIYVFYETNELGIISIRVDTAGGTWTITGDKKPLMSL
jgi:hypothetical protein